MAGSKGTKFSPIRHTVSTILKDTVKSKLSPSVLSFEWEDTIMQVGFGQIKPSTVEV